MIKIWLNQLGALSLLLVGLVAACSDDDETGGDAEAGAAGEASNAGAPGTAGALGAAGSHASAGAAGGAGMSGDGGLGGAGEAGASGGPGVVAGAGGSGEAGSASAGNGESGAGGAGGAASSAISGSTVLDVKDVAAAPESYAWQEFRPNVLKLFLAGAAETEHIAILWYTVVDGGVGLHYHSKTESVYVIDGSQTDAKGVYTDGTVYFNPPESGHQISNSGGFFLLAYAAPPDFVNTSLIEAYEPIRIDTTADDLTTSHTFVAQAEGVQTYAVPLDAGGGMAAELIETSSQTPYSFAGNYLLVLEGSCVVQGVELDAGMLVVADDIEPQAYEVSAPAAATCLTMGVSF